MLCGLCSLSFVFLSGVLGPLHGLFILLLSTDRVDRDLGCKCQLLLYFCLQVLFENSATFNIVFRAVLIRFPQRGLVHQGRPNLNLFNQLFWVILIPYCTIGIIMSPLKSFFDGQFSKVFRAKICLLQPVSDFSSQLFVKQNISPMIFPIIAIAFCRYWQFKAKQYLKGVCPNNNMSSFGKYRRNFASFDETLKWIQVHFFYVLLHQVILFSTLQAFEVRPQTNVSITHIIYILYWSLYHGIYLPTKMKIPEYQKRRHVSSFFVCAPQFLEPRGLAYCQQHVVTVLKPAPICKKTNWRKKKKSEKHLQPDKIEVCHSQMQVEMPDKSKSWLVPNQGGNQKRQDKIGTQLMSFETRLQSDEIFVEVGGQNRKKAKVDDIRICSLPVPPPLVIYVTPCDGGAEQVEEISGQDPVDPVDPTISSQHTLSKKMRVGLENWVSAAREWIVKRKPATGSSGSDQGEKVDDKRRRGGEESKRRRRSTLIVDLGLQLVSTRPQPLAKIDS